MFAFSAKRIRRHLPLFAILLLFVVLVPFYALNTPPFEGADEPAHFEYVRSLANGEGLPLLQKMSGRSSIPEAHQPPLYYVAAAAATFWIEMRDGVVLGGENPHRTFDPLALTNRNLFVHTRAETFPYRGAVLAIHIARLISLLFGAGALIATYGMARTLFPARPEVWAGAAAFAAFLPQFDFVAAMVSNDSAVICMVALALWQLARVAARTKVPAGVRARELILLGLLTGLSALAKDSGVLLLPFALLVLLPLLWARTGWRSALRAGFVVAVVCLLAAGWWYILRHAVLGYWLGSPVSAAPGRELVTLGDLLAQWQEIEISFWGLFGWNIVPLPQAVYDSLHWVTVLAVAGLAVFVARRRAKGRETAVVAALLMWALLVLAAFVRWVSATEQPHGRLLFPALPAFAILVCLGLAQWMPQRLRPILIGCLASALFLTSVWAAVVVLPAAYPQPNFVAAGAPIPNPVDANLDNRIELLGYDWHVLRNGGRDVLAVRVYWKATAPIDNDYTVTIQAFRPDGLRVGHLDTYPVSGMHPTSDWQVGEIVRDEYPLEISANAGSTVKVMIGMYDLDTGKALQVIRSDGTRTGRVTIGDVYIPDVSK
jgi:4-amino-4-deoxy-L-arabinose transferase-like glycosyltransferase